MGEGRERRRTDETEKEGRHIYARRACIDEDEASQALFPHIKAVLVV